MNKLNLVNYDPNDGVWTVSSLVSNASATGVIYLTVLDNIV